MLELKNICFTRDNKKILDDVSLKIDDNKFYVITGPNGSGKSTLVKMIMGIELPDSGSIWLDGKDITALSIDKRAELGISFAFQTPVLFKGITVFDLLKISKGGILKSSEAATILSRVGLNANEYLGREINNSLSGGELKRIEIASVLAREGLLTIFDEPEAGIDLWSFNSLTEIFKSLQGTSKTTNIVISHQERILNIADEIILMEHGKIKLAGAKEKVLESIFEAEEAGNE